MAKMRKELAKQLMEGLLARLDSPNLLTIPEQSLAPLEIDEDWSLLKDVRAELFEETERAASTGSRVSPVSGTKSISLRVPNRVLRVYRQQSEKTGTAYQVLMNRALQEAADAYEYVDRI